VSVEHNECSGWPSTCQMTENVEKIQELIHEDRRWIIHELADMVGISYGVCQILRKNFNMHCIAPSSRKCTRPTHAWRPQSLRLTTTWLSFPSSLLSGLSPLWFRFLSQIENETKGTFWNIVRHPKGIAKRYWTALRKMTSTVLLKHG
jgi:hypothetical protein